MEILDNGLTAIIYLACSFILFLVGKVFYQLIHRNVNVKAELVEKDNFAFAVAHTGYFVGLLLAISSAVIGPSKELVVDIIDIFTYGGISIVLLNLSLIINDKLILRKFSVFKEILEDRNVGTGVIEAASAIATGLIIIGSVSGEGGSWLTAVIFWLAGQLMLLLTAFIYNLITPYDLHKYIEMDNVGVGIGFAGALIAIGNLIRFALMPDFESWTESFINVGVDVGIGLLFLPIVRFLTDKILLPGSRLTDEIINQEHPNIGAALIEAFAYIGGSVLITLCL